MRNPANEIWIPGNAPRSPRGAAARRAFGSVDGGQLRVAARDRADNMFLIESAEFSVGVVIEMPQSIRVLDPAPNEDCLTALKCGQARAVLVSEVRSSIHNRRERLLRL